MQRILIAPSDLVQPESGQSWLDRRSVSVRMADDAEAALEAITTWEPALVIFGDFGKPTVRGFCKQVQEAVSPRPVPRLLHVCDPTELEEATGAPCDALLAMPLQQDVFQRTVAGLLDLRFRRAPRVQARVLARLKLGGAEARRMLVSILSISPVGLLVAAPEPLRLRERVDVDLYLPGTATLVALRCEVHYPVDETLHHYALEILTASAKDQNVLRTFVDQRQPE